VNPRASRTVPYVCKATGIPLIRMATRIMLGEKLSAMRDLIPAERPKHVAVKAPVFPFNKFKGADPKLGPEMKSTGEVMGIDIDFPLAFAKAQLAVHQRLPESGQVFISVNDFDKAELVPVARQLAELGFSLVATEGTARAIQEVGLPVLVVRKKHEGSPNVEDMIDAGHVALVINTPIGEEALIDDSYIRKAAIAGQIPLITTIGGAKALAEGLLSMQQNPIQVKCIQEFLQPVRKASALIS
jgi:carbamoyl-phosphate synthase large subunit